MADASEQLAWEARQKPRAAIAAIIAAFGVVLMGWHPFPDINPLDTPGIVVQYVLSDAPLNGVLNALETAAEPGPMAEVASQKVARYADLSGETVSILGLTLGSTLTLIAAAISLCVLSGATRGRSSQLSPALFYVVVAGAAITAIANLVFVITIDAYADEIVAARPTVAELQQIDPGIGSQIGQGMALVGRVLLAGGWILIALNAMRVGLLTRFMGALGIIAGVLMIIPIGPMPFVIMFWLLSLSMLFAGRWPGGNPPAWASGKAEPWQPPAARGAGSRPAGKPAREPREPKPKREPAGIEHPSSKKRKRKRRG
jgi:hypothetical protein